MPESSAAPVTGHLALRAVPGAAFGAAMTAWVLAALTVRERARKARSGHEEPPGDMHERNRQEAA